MKPHLFLLFAVNLGINIALFSPTVAQITPNLASPSPIQKGILQAQTTDIETLRQIETLIQQAIQYTQQGKPQQAIETLQQLLRLAQQQGIKEIEAVAYLGLGFNYHSIGQPQPALENYQQALSIFREVGDLSVEATTLNNIGAVYQGIGQPEEALKFLNQALPILQEVGDRGGEAITLNNIGEVYGGIGQPEEALKYYNQALPIKREVGDRGGEAITLNNIGEVYGGIGQPEEALKYYNQALPIKREVGDRGGEATTLNNIGVVYRGIGQLEEALKYYNQALPISREVGDRGGEATTLNNIGEVYGGIGQPEEALKFLNQALPILQEVGDRGGEATTLNNIGAVYQGIGQPEEALKYFNQALPITREVGDRGGEATTLNNIGLVYDGMGQPEEALKYYNQALPISREVGDRGGEATTLNNIGVVYRGIGQPEEALKFLNQALPILQEVGDRGGEATTLNNIGVVYRGIGQPEEALKFYNQALPIRREVGDRSGEATTLNNIGVVYRDSNQPDKAIAVWEESLEIKLSIRKGLKRENRKAFIEAEDNTAIALVDLLIKQNQPRKAYEWANRVTTFDLADYNRLIDAQVANREAQKALDDWNAQNRRLEALRQDLQENYSQEKAQQMREFEEQVNSQREPLINQYPELAELLEITPTDIAQLQQNIAKDTLVIQPFLLTGIPNVDDTIAFFLITQDSFKVIQTEIDADEFNQLVITYRNQLADYQNSDVYETSSQLYNLLIAPIETDIKAQKPKRLAIIATGNLRYIPFETFYNEQTDEFLLQAYPIHYLTRISTNNPPNPPSKGGNMDSASNSIPSNPASKGGNKNMSALAFANPKPTKVNLEGTEKEADYLTNNFPKSKSYKGETATLNTFKNQASNFRILHLGTHGCFNPLGCPDLDMKANTILFANRELYHIRNAALLGLSNTEILTLSACETAREAKDSDGIELSGLAFVLERAGAKSVIASLWNADDNISAEIMTKFYSNLQQGMDKSEAMRQAKLTQIEKLPFSWSPFIIIGEGD